MVNSITAYAIVTTDPVGSIINWNNSVKFIPAFNAVATQNAIFNNKDELLTCAWPANIFNNIIPLKQT